MHPHHRPLTLASDTHIAEHFHTSEHMLPLELVSVSPSESLLVCQLVWTLAYPLAYVYSSPSVWVYPPLLPIPHSPAYPLYCQRHLCGW